MRNIQKTKTDPQKGLKEAGKGLWHTNPCYTAYQSEKGNLTKLFDEYTSHTNPCTLEVLKTAYPASDPNHSKLYDLYDSQRKFLQDLRKEVFEQGSRLILCPLCNHTEVQDLDHYIPRAEMPEYSVHFYNLIPICHQCNLDKGDLWLDSAGKRVFFNAYFDNAPDMTDVLDCSVAIDAKSQTLKVILSAKPITGADTESVRLAKSTIDKLDLIKRYWQTNAEQTLNGVRKQFVNQYRVIREKPVVDVFIDQQIEVVKMDMADSSPIEMIPNIVRKTILTSDMFRQWVVNELSKLNNPVCQ